MRLLIFLLAVLIPACASSRPAFRIIYSAYKLNKQMTIYSLDILLSWLESVCCSISSSNCCFLTWMQISLEAGEMVWYSCLLKNFPQFVVIHTVKAFGLVSRAEVDVFLKLFCYIYIYKLKLIIPRFQACFQDTFRHNVCHIIKHNKWLLLLCSYCVCFWVKLGK